MKLILAIHAVLAVIVVGWILAVAIRVRRRERRNAQILRLHARPDGPPTLHPVIDSELCIGSAACVRACPEDRALVIVGNRAHLAHASGCVGHGECQRACPVNAITLVFGSARRGVDLPEVDQHFESSHPGLYIAGELGGMGLIATAVRQGVKATEAIVSTLRGERDDESVVPLLIVGAGPAGIAAMLTAHRHAIRARWIEKETSMGGAVRSYPRGKVVMTTPVDLPLYGRVHVRRTSKAALIELWNDVLSRHQIQPEYGVTLQSVVSEGDVLVATTSAGTIRARRVLLATGRRGKPRHLGVAGEDLAHVFHHVDDPMEHDGQRILVVGGGDVAVESALALAERPNTRVTLCHRNSQFDRAKPANQERLAEAERAGLHVLRNAQVQRIDPASALVMTLEGLLSVDADRVFVLIGSDLPLDLLAATGVRVQTHHGLVVRNDRTANSRRTGS